MLSNALQVAKWVQSEILLVAQDAERRQRALEFFILLAIVRLITSAPPFIVFTGVIESAKLCAHEGRVLGTQ